MEKTPAPSPELYHVSLNPSASETIIFVHGLGSMHMEWKDVVPHIQNYHMIMVDVNGHGESSHITPYTIPAGADNVATTIRKHAHGGSAHVVGLSMGGFITIELARRYPELVKSAFISGAVPPEGMRRFFFSRPAILWSADSLQLALPESVYWWAAKKQGLLRHDELYVHAKTNRRWEVFRDVFLSICEVTWDDVKAVNVRTLVVAGGKMDDVQGTRKMGPLLRVGADETSGSFVVAKAGHAWNMQFPELFAKGVVAWVAGSKLPQGFD